MSQSLVGGAVALLLVFSGSPAYGQDSPPDGAGSGVSEEAPSTSPEPSEEAVPEGENPEPEGGDGSLPGADPSEIEDVDEEAAPGPTEHVDPNSPESDTSEAADGEVTAERDASTAVPTSIEISGTIYVVPDEAAPQTPDQIAAGEELAIQAGGALVATEQAGLVRLDTAGSEGALESGNLFEGEIVLPEAAIEAVDERIEAEGDLSDAEIAQTAAIAANAESAELVATGVGLDTATPTAEVVSSRTHPVDVRYFSGGGPTPTPSSAQMQALITTASAYWKTQTGGKISSMPISSYGNLVASNRCDLYSLWNQAIWDLGYFDANDYLTSGRHLVVFVNKGCGGAYGVGTVGSLHSGGVTWVDLGMRGQGVPVADAAHALTHELGHNLGLGHSDARTCSRPSVDAKSSRRTGLPVAGTGCSDAAYGDLWSVMGGAAQGYGTKPVALTIAQKQMLGLTSSSMLTNVTSSGGVAQTFEIQAASATSGIRGLRVSSPSPGTSFFVEYRNGAGQDSGMPWSGGAWNPNLPFFDGTVGKGVRVLKGYSTGAAVAGKRSAVLSRWSGSTRSQVIRTGQFITPYSSTVRAVVTSTTSTSAKVTILYKGFRSGGKSVSTKVSSGGKLIAGKTLRASTSGKWAVTFGAAPSKSNITERYQWLRNGAAISGATKSSYRTTAADIGKKISVRVKPKSSGWLSGKGSVSASKTVAGTPFVDVIYGDRAYTQMSWMRSAGITDGTQTSAGQKYRPASLVTREAMAAFLFRMESPAGFTPPAVSPFRDIATTDQYYTEIAWMYESGIYRGVKKSGHRYFNPTTRVTREAMAVYLYRLRGTSYSGPKSSPFADVKKSSTYYDEIAWVNRTGIWKGVPQKSGKPKFQASRNLTREEMAIFMYRFTH